MERRYELFDEILANLKDGTKITFTRDNIAEGDHFLNLRSYDHCTCTFRWHELIWVYFDNDEPMLLEDCPTSFYESIVKNLAK